MDNTNARADEQNQAPETPEDVAILYSWANLPGAKYRDFSASRREYRAQQRARAAEAQRQAELQAARELEEAAQREIADAQRNLEETQRAEAKAAADAAQEAADAEAKRRAEEVLRQAEERAEQERREAVRRQQSAEELRLRAERAQEEMLVARKRAEEQAARYEADLQSQLQLSQQARVLPGEISDPYYYTGPVDPAYFASTPGVRTAQATRVSSERKSYVYPMHPGSDEYDSGTVVAYRSTTQFAPSPAHMDESDPLQKGEFAEFPQPRRPEQERSVREAESTTGYDLDDDYYDGSHASRLFSPPLTSRYTEGRETAAADLHIRPASRVSGDHESPQRTVRPSPMPQSAFLPTAGRLPEITGQGEPSATSGSESDHRKGGGQPFLEVIESAPRRDQALRESAPAANSDPASMLRTPYPGSEKEVSATLRPLRFEESGDADPDGSSRMFIPSPRRRMLHMEQVAAAAAPEPTAAETAKRDLAALEGQQRAKAEVSSREAQDRFVKEQEASDPNAGESAEAVTPLVPEAAKEAVAADAQPVHWRSLERTGESGLRRRRQPGREPVARTARQPRADPETEAAAESQSINDVSAPPAWLSGERPAVRRADMTKVEGAETTADLPATPGDPGVPVPRMIPRRQASGLRPRPTGPAPAANTPLGTSTDPADPKPAGKPAQEQWRTGQDLGTSIGQATANDTLQQSRERVASRWFALSGLMGAEGRQLTEPRAGLRSVVQPAPMLSVLSISGGVGKTSIVATLGRALSSLGEKVMLADTSVHGVLPYYFGAREQRPGVARTFSPPPGSSDAPVVLVSYDADGRGYDEAGKTRVLDDLYRRSSDVQRVLVDAGVNSAWLARTVAGTNPWVLVPVAPDMNSVLGTQAVERLFQDVTGPDGRPVQPYYVLNQYEPSMPLHLDVREVLRQFLGDRLLPIMLHRTPAVSEALAEGMTVIDYAPRAPIANDYMNLAAWVRNLADPGQSYPRPARWSER